MGITGSDHAKSLQDSTIDIKSNSMDDYGHLANPIQIDCDDDIAQTDKLSPDLSLYERN